MVARTLRQKGLSVAIGGEDLLRDCPSIITIRRAAPSYALAQELLRDPSDKLSHAAKNREAFAHFNVRA